MMEIIDFEGMSIEQIKLAHLLLISYQIIIIKSDLGGEVANWTHYQVYWLTSPLLLINITHFRLFNTTAMCSTLVDFDASFVCGCSLIAQRQMILNRLDRSKYRYIWYMSLTGRLSSFLLGIEYLLLEDVDLVDEGQKEEFGLFVLLGLGELVELGIFQCWF